MAPLFQNLSDFDRFNAGEAGETVPLPDDSQVMREQLELIAMAEPLGYDSVWTFEHRATPYSMCPSPQQLLAYVAGMTKKISVGTMVTVLPWHNPVRLAENIALLQHMLGPDRKFRLGLGRGLGRREYESLGIDQSETRSLYSEGIEIVQALLRGERVSFEGEVHQLTNSVVRPFPLNSGPVDDAYGVWNGADSMEASAKAGLSPLTVPSRSMEMFAADFDIYDGIRAKYGHGPSSPPILEIFLYCSESEQQAQEWAAQYADEYSRSAVWNYELGSARFNTLKGYEDYSQGVKNRYGDPGDDIAVKAAEKVSKLIQKEGLVGTPEQCLENLEAINQMMSPQEIVLIPSSGTMRFEDSASSLKLFADRALAKAQTLTSAKAEAFFALAQ